MPWYFPGSKLVSNLLLTSDNLWNWVTNVPTLQGNQHCEIAWDGKEDRTSNVTVKDLSSNGTFVGILFISHITLLPDRPPIRLTASKLGRARQESSAKATRLRLVPAYRNLPTVASRTTVRDRH